MHEMAVACNKHSTALLFDKMVTLGVELCERRAQQQSCAQSVGRGRAAVAYHHFANTKCHSSTYAYMYSGRL